MCARSTNLALGFRLAAACVAVMLASLPAQSQATVLYSQSFNTDTANALLTYPEFTLNNGTSASVASGVLNLVSNGGNSMTVDGIALGVPSKFLVKTDLGGLGSTVTFGSDAVGLRIGNYTFCFFPTYPNGALQIRTVNGAGAPSALIVPDTSITFTPAADVMHHMEIEVDGQDFVIKVTNGNAPFQTGTILFTPTGLQPVYVPGEIGFAQINSLTGLYDNFVIDDLIVVPEPSTMILLGLGVVGLAVRRRRRAIM